MFTRLSIYENLNIEPDSDEAWVLLSLDQQELYGLEIVERVKEISSDAGSLRLGWVFVILWFLNGKGLVNGDICPDVKKGRRKYSLTKQGKDFVSVLQEINDWK